MEKTISNEFYLMNDYKSVTKIDSHFHLNSKNNVLVELANADNFQLIAMITDVPFFPPLDQQKELIIAQSKQFPGKVHYVTAFSLDGWESTNWAEKEIEKLKADFAKGALGVKVWKNIGMTHKDASGKFVMIDNPKFDKVIDFIIEQGKMVIGHLGEPRNCWLPIEKMTVKNDRGYFVDHPEYHMFLHPEDPSYEDQINARDKFLERHPNLQFIGAHLGSLEWSVDELAKRLDKFPNMAVDVADRICHLQYQSRTDREKVRNFFIKYQDRLIYATDFIADETNENGSTKNEWHDNWVEDWKYFVTNDLMTASRVDGQFNGLQLPKSIIDKLYFKNAVRWFKMK